MMGAMIDDDGWQNWYENGRDDRWSGQLHARMHHNLTLMTSQLFHSYDDLYLSVSWVDGRL